MKNFIQQGCALDVASTPTGGYTAGNFYVYGILGGVAALTSLETEANELHLEGVFSLAKTTSQAWTFGQQLFWDPGTSKFTTVPGELTSYGVVAKAAGSADTTGYVLLNDGKPMAAGPIAQQAAIADLGTTHIALATSGGNTYSDAAVNTAVNALADTIVAKINTILAELRLAGTIEDA